MYRILSTTDKNTIHAIPVQKFWRILPTVCFRWFKDNLDYVDADKNAAIWGWVSNVFHIPENYTVAIILRVRLFCRLQQHVNVSDVAVVWWFSDVTRAGQWEPRIYVRYFRRSVDRPQILRCVIVNGTYCVICKRLKQNNYVTDVTWSETNYEHLL